MMDAKFWELYQKRFTKDDLLEYISFMQKHSLEPFVDENGEEYYWLDQNGLHGMPRIDYEPDKGGQ